MVIICYDDYMQKNHGFSLVEVLVGSAVLVVFFSAISVMVYASVKTVGEVKVKTIAANLAQERLEVVRNMPYGDVGTVGGIPAGLIDTPEVVAIDNLEYTIETFIAYIDDPYDGEAPADTSPTDYKRVRVSVSWNGVFSSTSLSMISLCTVVLIHGSLWASTKK